MRKFLVLVVALVALLVVADRIAVQVADSAIASAVQKNQDMTTKPSVDITGFPFLTQVVDGRFSKIDFSATGVRTQGAESVVVDDIRAVLTDVRTSRSLSTITAGTARGTGTVTYASLSQRIGVTLSYGGTTADGRGRVQGRKSVTVAGQTFSATISAALGVSGDMLTFADVTVAGVSLPSDLTSLAETAFATQLSLSGLPAGLHVTDLAASPAGISATLSGTNVRLK